MVILELLLMVVFYKGVVKMLSIITLSKVKNVGLLIENIYKRGTFTVYKYPDYKEVGKRYINIYKCN